MKKYFVLLSFLLLTACSSSIPINYVASPISTIDGTKVWVGSFKYLPADNGKVRQNQFEQATGSIGTMYTSENIANLMKESLVKEFIAAGAKINDSNIVVNGEVEKFLYDWIGYVEVDFYLDVKYTITKNGKVLFSKTIKTHQASPKTLNNDPEAIKQVIAKNIHQLFAEYKF